MREREREKVRAGVNVSVRVGVLIAPTVHRWVPHIYIYIYRHSDVTDGTSHELVVWCVDGLVRQWDGGMAGWRDGGIAVWRDGGVVESWGGTCR